MYAVSYASNGGVGPVGKVMICAASPKVLCETKTVKLKYWHGPPTALRGPRAVLAVLLDAQLTPGRAS